MLWRCSMGRTGLFLLIAGGVLGFLGYQETTLAAGMTPEPEEMTLAQLIERGIEGNPYIRVRDFSLGDNFVLEEKSGRWNMVYVPAAPRSPQVPPGIMVPLKSPIQVIVMSGKVRNDEELQNLAKEPALTGMVINRIKSLNKQQKELLVQSYPGTDFDSCLIFNHGRAVI